MKTRGWERVVICVEEERQGKKRQRYHGRGKARFLLNIDAIKADLKLGSRRWAYEETWRAQLQVSYSQFARYIQELIDHGARTSEAPETPAPPVVPVVAQRPPLASSPAASQTTPRQALRPSATQFHFDPAEAHQRTDLV